MGRIAKLLSFVRSVAGGAQVSDVKVDPGGLANVTAQHFADPGDDSHPLPGDYVVVVKAAGTGRVNSVGYLDPKNEQKAGPGEKRIYARDSGGERVVEVWLKATGEAIIVNDKGSSTLRPDGGSIITTPASTFDCAASGAITGQNDAGNFDLRTSGDFYINGARVTPAGDFITANGVSVDNHHHGQGPDSAGNTEVPTNIPTPTE